MKDNDRGAFPGFDRVELDICNAQKAPTGWMRLFRALTHEAVEEREADTGSSCTRCPCSHRCTRCSRLGRKGRSRLFTRLGRPSAGDGAGLTVPWTKGF